MTDEIKLSCQCGAVEALIHNPSPKTSNHAICYCEDCQAFTRHLGASDATDKQGGTELYQTLPCQVEITKGEDKIAVLQLARKGLYRWHTTCCNTPIGNSLGTPKFSFIALVVSNMKNPQPGIGAVQFRYKREQALSPVAEPSGKLAVFAFRTMKNALRARLNGTWKQTPFFDIKTGRSIVKPYVLSDAERAAAYQP